jgi:hypothetical protein
MKLIVDMLCPVPSNATKQMASGISEYELRNVNQRLREVAGLDDENENTLLKRKAEMEQAQESAFAQAKQAGVDPALVGKARADWKQAQSLYDLDSQIKMSMSGLRPELAQEWSSVL